jgi:hypothetical protein
VNARTDAAFSALVGLDPLRRVPGPDSATSWADPASTDTGTQIAHIIATPRSGPITALPATRRALRWKEAPHRRRVRFGALGLAASAAIAVITTLLWASPSAGSPPDQAVNVPAQISQTHTFPPT